MASLPTPWLALAAALAVGALLGLTLLILGLWPRRRGDVPHCRKCGYNLTGAPAGRCSECGATLTARRAIRTGTRYRRWGLAATGVLLLLLVAAPVVTIAVISARDFDWLPYAPKWLVRSELDSTDEKRVNRALLDLQRRQINGTLTDAELLNLADWCLIEQGRPTLRDSLARPAIAILGDLVRARQLSEDRLGQFCRQACVIHLRPRSPALLHGTCPMEVSVEKRMPSSMTALIDLTSAGNLVRLISNKPIRTFDFDPPHPEERPFRFGESIDTGRHELPFDARIRLSTGPGQSDELEYDATVRLMVPVEIVWPEPDDYIRTRQSPELDEAVRKCIRNVIVQHDISWPNKSMFGALLETEQTALVPLAFELSILGPDGEFWTSDFMTNASGRWMFTGRGSSEFKKPLPDRFTVVLRSSKRVAKETVDLFEIWGGEIRFEDVKLQIVTSRPSPRPPQTQNSP